jgi:hypothetical protein
MIDTLMKGVDTGSKMYSGIMNPILKREEQKQLDEHFKQELAFKKAAAGRAGANSDLTRQIMQERLLGLKHTNDPMYQMNQWKALQDMMMVGRRVGRQSMPQEEAPTQKMGENMPMLSPEGMQAAQQEPQAPQGGNMGGNMGGINLEALRENPMLRGLFKHMFKVDPLAAVPQTPQEKQTDALDLFKQKEQIKAANKTGSGETLTAPIKTKYQNVIGGVSTARPILQKLIKETKKGNIPGQAIGAFFNRDSQASYKGEVSTLLDGVRNAYTIPNTDSGTAKAEDKVLKKPGESDANYAKRLQSILDQMDYREKDARLKLNVGNITASLVHLVGPDGEDYDVPSNEVDAIIAKYPGVRRG